MEPNKENLQKNMNQNVDGKVSVHKHTSLIISIVVLLAVIAVVFIVMKNKVEPTNEKERMLQQLNQSIPQGVGPDPAMLEQLNNSIPNVKGPTEPPPEDNQNFLEQLNNSIPKNK